MKEKRNKSKAFAFIRVHLRPYRGSFMNRLIQILHVIDNLRNPRTMSASLGAASAPDPFVTPVISGRASCRPPVGRALLENVSPSSPPVWPNRSNRCTPVGTMEPTARNTARHVVSLQSFLDVGWDRRRGRPWRIAALTCWLTLQSRGRQ
jgi:hypothetical protein